MLRSRFLILDDDSAVAQTIQWLAEEAGFDARFVINASALLREIEEWNPEYVALDLVMPGLDGVEVMSMLAKRQFRGKLIITSGMGNRVLDAAQRSAKGHGLDVIGVLSKPLTCQKLNDLLQAYSTDMPASKLPPRNGYSDRFVPSIADLTRAIKQRELIVAYQPKIECATNAIIGFEGLVRWQHPKLGLIFPDDFVPLAEKCNLIGALSEQVVAIGLEWLSKVSSHSDLGLSLNISAKNLEDVGLVDRLYALCKHFAISSERIILELTETSAMVDPLLSLDLMTRFRMKGFQLSLDDFGTGFSSMLQLVRLPFSEIKVDKTFVMSSMLSHESRAVIQSIISLGHSLDLTVTAEGVEEQQTLDWLCSHSCDQAQGYLIAKPMLGDAAMAWLGQNKQTVGGGGQMQDGTPSEQRPMEV